MAVLNRFLRPVFVVATTAVAVVFVVFVCCNVGRIAVDLTFFSSNSRELFDEADSRVVAATVSDATKDDNRALPKAEWEPTMPRAFCCNFNVFVVLPAKAAPSPLVPEEVAIFPLYL